MESREGRWGPGQAKDAEEGGRAQERLGGQVCRAKAATTWWDWEGSTRSTGPAGPDGAVNLRESF